MLRPRRSRWLLALLSLTLFLSAHRVAAQTEAFVPATTGFDTDLRVWTSNGITYAKVHLSFPTGGWRVQWGELTRNGNDFSSDSKIERWTGVVTLAFTFEEHTYNLGALPPGNYSFTFKSWGTTIKSKQFDPTQVVEHWEPAILPTERVGVRIFTLSSGVTYAKVELYFPDYGYSVTDWGQVVRGGNTFTIDLKAEHFTGQSAPFTIRVDNDYPLGTLDNGPYTVVVKMYGTTARTQSFNITASTNPPRLLTEDNSERAIALDSVTWLRLFPVITGNNFSPDRRARIMLLAANLELQPGENASMVTAQATDAQGKVYPLAVEYVGKVPGFDWLTEVVVKPTDDLKGGGDVWVTVSAHGLTSNRALVTLKPSAAETQ